MCCATAILKGDGELRGKTSVLQTAAMSGEGS